MATNRKIQLVSELHQASARYCGDKMNKPFRVLHLFTCLPSFSNYSAFKKELLQRLSVLGAENAK